MESKVTIRKYSEKDITQMLEIWNEIVEEGIAFPQENTLDKNSAKEFFESLFIISLPSSERALSI